jgi:CubicO group peptidase (beta-lactamase class C family)
MKNIALIFLITFCASCAHSQSNDKEYFETALPDEKGMMTEPVKQLIRDIESNKIQNVHALVIIKDSMLICDKYFNGFGRGDLHYSASVTKSFASALLGIAIDKGFIKGEIREVLDRSVSDLFPEYKELIGRDSMKKDLKLKHMLSMTAGFRWDEHSHPYSDSRNDCYRINHSKDPMKFLFERRLINQPGSEFYYNGGLSLSISYLIENYTGMKLDRFAEKYLFEALGIKEYRWEKLSSGLFDTDGGLHLKPLDQAKLGYLFLNGGIWRGQQLVSEEWVKESTNVQLVNDDSPDYAYQWWCGDFFAFNATFPTFFASGHGGQKVVVLPEFDLVLVIAQQVFHNNYGDFNFLVILGDYILPALKGVTGSPSPIDPDPGELLKLEGTYMSQDGNEFINVVAEEDRLFLHSSDGQENVFYSLGQNKFAGRIQDLLSVQIEFVRDVGKREMELITQFGYSVKQLKRVEE